MKKNIYLFIAISIFGCSSDDSSDQQNNEQNTTGVVLTTIIETELNSNTSYTSNLYYNNGVVSKIETKDKANNVEKSEFIYNNSILTSINYYKNALPTGSFTFTYEGTKITSGLSFEDGISFNHVYEYKNEQVVKNSQYNNGKYSSSEMFEYYTSGNISKTTHTAFTGSNTYQYDDKKNPYSLIFSDAVMKIYGVGYSKNNILKENENTVYEYTYNESGYPTQVIEKYNGVATYKTKYIYQ